MSNINNKIIKKMIEEAIKAKEKSYAIFSHFRVGATILTDDDEIFSGCNIESAAYSPTICAERTAIFKAISEGATIIKFIVVIADAENIFPCGVCRQVIKEFGPNAEVCIANSIDDYKRYTIDELLPHSFTIDSLK